MVTLIFLDPSKKTHMAKRGVDETREGFVGKMINVPNLLALSMCPRQHEAELNAVPRLGEELMHVIVQECKIMAHGNRNV